MTDLLHLHRIAMDGFTRRVHAVRPDQWNAPTPCSEWTVRQLLAHLVEEQSWAAPLLHGETLAQVGDRFAGDLLGGDPVVAWDRSSAGAAAAWAEPGAWDRTVDLSRGPTPSEQYGLEMTADLLLHGWDLAAAVGTDRRDVDPALVHEVLVGLEPLVGLWQAIGIFAAPVPVPPDADELDRLLALSGRSPDWTAPR